MFQGLRKKVLCCDRKRMCAFETDYDYEHEHDVDYEHAHEHEHEHADGTLVSLHS